MASCGCIYRSRGVRQGQDSGTTIHTVPTTAALLHDSCLSSCEAIRWQPRHRLPRWKACSLHFDRYIFAGPANSCSSCYRCEITSQQGQQPRESRNYQATCDHGVLTAGRPVGCRAHSLKTNIHLDLRTIMPDRLGLPAPLPTSLGLPFTLRHACGHQAFLTSHLNFSGARPSGQAATWSGFFSRSLPFSRSHSRVFLRWLFSDSAGNNGHVALTG